MGKYNEKAFKIKTLLDANLQSVILSSSILDWYNNQSLSMNFSNNAVIFKNQTRKLLTEDICNSLIKIWEHGSKANIYSLIDIISNDEITFLTEDIENKILKIEGLLDQIRLVRDKIVAHSDFVDEQNIEIPKLKTIIEETVSIVNEINKYFGLKEFERERELNLLQESFKYLNKV